MSRKLFIAVSIFIGFVLFGYCLLTADKIRSQVKNENSLSPPPSNKISREQKNENQSSGKVDFKGVSFSYNPQIFGAAEFEEVAEFPLENESDKPDNVAPRHLLLTLKKSNRREAVIAVYPIRDFRRVWKPVEKNTKYIFDDELENLRKVIKNTKFRRGGREIPYLLYYDAHQTFNAKVKSFSFQSGKGIFFLSQINQDVMLVNNDRLTYYFQGITGDGKHFVLAEFPVKVSFLPDSWRAEEFEDYQIPAYFYADKTNQKRYDQYISKITKRLENLPPDQYEPNLKRFEEIISSLKIEK